MTAYLIIKVIKILLVGVAIYLVRRFWREGNVKAILITIAIILGILFLL